MNAIKPSFAPIVLAVAAVLVLGCENENGADAHGNFQADEVTVSSQASGQLLRFTVEEGDRLAAGSLGASSVTPPAQRPEKRPAPSVVGLVYTTSLALKRRELRARRTSVRSKMQTVQAEIDVLRQQLQAARRELKRVRRLREGDAAPERQVDQAADEVRILERRIEATRTQTAGLRDEIAAIDEQIAQVNEQIQKSWIVNPIDGTVLTTYVEKGEVVRTGEPLYTVASLDTLTLRAYISGSQLADVTIGQDARVLIDTSASAREARTGRVTWIASEAEFTPTPIQTREERVDFVYAVDIRVPNPDGALKIGMPADVVFESGGAGASPDTTIAGLR